MPDWKEEIQARLSRAGLKLAREPEIVEELSQHLDDRYQELCRSGLAEAEASRAALAEFSEKELRQQFSHREYAYSQPPVLGAETGSALGGKIRAAPATLLPADACRPRNAQIAAQHLA